MALVISVLVLALGAALVWGPDRSLGGLDVEGIGVVVLAVGVIGVLVSLLLSKRAASERALAENRPWYPEGRPRERGVLVEVEEAPDEEAQRFRSDPPHAPPHP